MADWFGGDKEPVMTATYHIGGDALVLLRAVAMCCRELELLTVVRSAYSRRDVVDTASACTCICSVENSTVAVAVNGRLCFCLLDIDFISLHQARPHSSACAKGSTGLATNQHWARALATGIKVRPLISHQYPRQTSLLSAQRQDHGSASPSETIERRLPL